MIGDTPEDLLAGKSAGALTCGVTYGFGSLASIQSAEPDIIIDEISKLVDYFE
jgi:phosphoglycolate phosphatase-like HAD superfamily hydrolase